MTITRTIAIEQPWGTVLVVCPTTTSIEDRATVDEFHDELLAAITPPECVLAIVDFSDVHTCNSEVLGSLLRAQKLMFSTGRMLRVANLAPPLSNMFTLCSLDVIIPVAATIEDAIAEHAADMKL